VRCSVAASWNAGGGVWSEIVLAPVSCVRSMGMDVLVVPNVRRSMRRTVRRLLPNVVVLVVVADSHGRGTVQLCSTLCFFASLLHVLGRRPGWMHVGTLRLRDDASCVELGIVLILVGAFGR